MALSVSSRNQRSTRFSHEEEVGVKCRWYRRAWPARLSRSDACGYVNVENHVHLEPVRLLAKQLGVDLMTIAPSSGDLISRQDVEAAASTASQAPPSASETVTVRETRVPIKGLRKATAVAMTRSAFTAPHVTEWLTVDVTRTMDMVRRLKVDLGLNCSVHQCRSTTMC